MASATQRMADNTLCQPRVLIVEDEARVRDDHIMNLTRWGYTPIVSEGRGLALLHDAVAKARARRCHVALVDMRLLNHDSQNDWSGLDLISKLKPTLGIIVSGYGDSTTVRAALKEKDAVDFVVKQDGPQRLKAVIEDVLANASACAKNLAIEWPAQMSSASIGQGFFPADPAIPDDEASDLLGRLFPGAGRLRLQTLACRHAPGRAPQMRSLILKVWQDDLQPVVVKLARTRRIETEDRRYREYIEGKLAGRFYARLQRSATLWDLGGIVYEFMGSTLGAMRPFSQYYAEARPEDIGYSLRHLFHDTWGERYRATSDSPHASLFAAYSETWGHSWHARLRQPPADFPAPFGRLGLPDPLRWVCARVGLDGDHDTSPPAPIRAAIGHGDLLGDNIFVDTDRRTWALDYERSGPGPIPQDFATLEADILMRLAEIAPTDLGTVLSLAIAIATPQQLDQQLELGSQHAGAHKALNVIQQLRRLASAHTQSDDLRPYLWGLLFSTVFGATLLAGQAERTAHHTRALLIASVCCHRLEHWGSEWPPGQWGSA